MTRKAYDSTTAQDTPMGGDLYLGYVDGNFTNVLALLARHPGKRVVGITVNGSNAANAQMGDIEAGNMGPTKGAQIAKEHLARTGEPFTLYFPASMRWIVARECRKVGLKTPGLLRGWNRDVLFFPANYDGKAKIPRWAVGKQYLHGDKGHPGSYSGGHYDVSVVRDYWPGVDPKPASQPTPLALRTRVALRFATGNLAGRDVPVVASDQPVLAAAEAQLQRVQGLK